MQHSPIWNLLPRLFTLMGLPFSVSSSKCPQIHPKQSNFEENFPLSIFQPNPQTKLKGLTWKTPWPLKLMSVFHVKLELFFSHKSDSSISSSLSVSRTLKSAFIIHPSFCNFKVFSLLPLNAIICFHIYLPFPIDISGDWYDIRVCMSDSHQDQPYFTQNYANIAKHNNILFTALVIPYINLSIRSISWHQSQVGCSNTKHKCCEYIKTFAGTPTPTVLVGGKTQHNWSLYIWCSTKNESYCGKLIF